MKHVFSILFLILLLIPGCSNDLVTTPKSDTNKGGLSLILKKSEAPQNVTEVVASLSRTDYETYKGSIEFLNDTSGAITFENIPVGTWQLNVDALDSDSTVVYKGETSVKVSAGITTQVNLTLTPTGLGTGNIEITVNWGRIGQQWVDYKNNPVFNASDLPYFSYSVSSAQVIYDNGSYKMWFENLYDAGKGNISYAESKDGISWNLGSQSPVLTAGSPGSWDDYSVGTGFALEDNGTYKYYYSGTRDSHYGPIQIGLATSVDGINWEKYPDPVIAYTDSQYFIGVQCVIKINNVYYMYYGAGKKNDYIFNINLATSTDGVHWTKYSGNPILIPEKSWESGSISYATVVKSDFGYTMSYSSKAQTGIGLAYSSDGIHWTKDSANPVFKLSDASNGWCSKISYPFSVMIGNEYRIYYSGYGSDGQYHLGFVSRK